MTQDNILSKFGALPPEAQQQVLDFMAFLETRYRPAKSTTSTRRLADEKFVGLWAGRKDLQDSSGWVRRVRVSEWGERAK